MNARLTPVATGRITVQREHACGQVEMLEKLRALLEKSFMLRQNGSSMREQATAQGYVDGYSAVLIDSGLVTQQEVLEVIQSARSSSLGPLSAPQAIEDDSSAVLVA